MPDLSAGPCNATREGPSVKRGSEEKQTSFAMDFLSRSWDPSAVDEAREERVCFQKEIQGRDRVRSKAGGISRERRDAPKKLSGRSSGKESFCEEEGKTIHFSGDIARGASQ